MDTPIQITDIAGLIEELGGLFEAAVFFGVTPQRLGNWRLRNQIPPALYFKHSELLQARGIAAARSLWGFSDGHDEQATKPVVRGVVIQPAQ